ncbi:E3 ubiquitin-protein ligase TRIM39 [Microcaecilia unicolor]|uniref:E3 ubiquitin-protein ligase TRIM39-like n=1 Tax=Microcaecilia unicolor TaxID=1415580 RepID=A0A6P7XJE9_9AMPH|nr:E3 ubiquitin-protein ligase TRIM39-like [Microcaecilia unicolor]
MSASTTTVRNLQNEAICAICLDYFTDPVSIACGHNYCRACITKHWEIRAGDVGGGGGGGGGVIFPCPQCRKVFRRRNFRPNKQLANIVEIVKQLQAGSSGSTGETPGEAGAAGDWEGDVDWTGPLCCAHHRPLRFYCREDSATVCLRCREEPDHLGHGVVTTEEAAREYRERLQSCLNPLKKQMEDILKVKSNEEKATRELKKEVERRRQRIVCEFELLHQVLNEEQRLLLTRLCEEEKTVLKKLKETVSKLSSKITALRKLVTEIENRCQQPTQDLLKDARNTLSRCEAVPMQRPNPVSPELEKSICSFPEHISPNILMKKYRADVTLDPRTANPGLILSDDRRSVKRGEGKQDLPDNPERFDTDPCVLGSEGFSSGRHYWEVEVGDGGHWVVGAARESVSKKGLISLTPKEGIWAVRLIRGLFEDRYQALTFPERTFLSPKLSPRKIGMYLDYEGGQLSFYNADTMAHIYTFSQPFREKIYPLFWVWSTETLTILCH